MTGDRMLWQVEFTYRGVTRERTRMTAYVFARPLTIEPLLRSKYSDALIDKAWEIVDDAIVEGRAIR